MPMPMPMPMPMHIHIRIVLDTIHHDRAVMSILPSPSKSHSHYVRGNIRGALTTHRQCLARPDTIPALSAAPYRMTGAMFIFF